MVWQRARELGALPTGLVKPGQVFEWKTLEPWADKISEAEARAETAAEVVPDAPHESLSGARVVPGRSHEVVLDRDAPRRRKPGRAETP